MRVIVHGAKGHMGQITTDLVKKGYDGAIFATAVDAFSEDKDVYKSLNDVTEKADVVIDFSHHSATKAVCDYCKEKNIPVVIATTGQNEEEKKIIEETSKTIPVFFSANMSIGIAVLASFAKQAAAMMKDADIEIVEVHHNRKLDAPSGTALLLAEEIKESRPEARIVCGRNGQQKRDKNDIGINSVRMGNVVGIHEVYISSPTQTITLKHEAHDRALFSEGAIKAAEFVVTKPSGLYNMKDLLV